MKEADQSWKLKSILWSASFNQSNTKKNNEIYLFFDWIENAIRYSNRGPPIQYMTQCRKSIE